MRLILFLLVLSYYNEALSRVVPQVNATGLLRWVFLHYHKTGHDVTENFSERLFKPCPNVKVAYSILKSKSLLSAHILVPRPLPYNLSNVFELPDFTFKVVHFVREPFDMVMSGYLYHKQQPRPRMEHFLEDPKFDPCYYDQDTFSETIIPALMQYTNNKVNVTQLIENVIHLCQQLSKKYGSENYSKTLNNVHNEEETFDILRLSASQALLDNIHGQVLVMAHNILQENIVKSIYNPNKVQFKRVFTSEFPADNVEVYHGSTMNLFDYLMPKDYHVSNGVFYDCLGSKEKVIQEAMLLSYERLPSRYSVNSTYFQGRSIGISEQNDIRRHITSDKINVTQRALLIKRLQSDAVIGPILLLVKNIVLNKSFQE